MPRLEWNKDGERFYETGVEDVALYLKKNVTATTQKPYANGVAWNGITAVNESPSGAEATALYADNIKYLNLISNEELGATVEAYMYPDEFAECDGSDELADGVSIGQQIRTTFGLCYKTKVGNDVDGNDKGYKLHLLYGATAAPSEKSYSTINESPEAITMSWELKTTPVQVAGKKPTALLTIDTTKLAVSSAAKLAALEAILYGAPEFSASKTYAVGDIVAHTESTVEKIYKCTTAVTTAGAWDASDWTEIDNSEGAPRLPLPDEVAAIFA